MASVHKRKGNCASCGRIYNLKNKELFKGYCFYCRKKIAKGRTVFTVERK